MKKRSFVGKKNIPPNSHRGNEPRSIARRFLATTGPLDSEPDVDVVVDLEVVVRIKRFDFITTVLLSSSPARKVAGAHRQPARDRGIKVRGPAQRGGSRSSAKRPCRLPAPASLADQATNSGERW